MRRIKRPKMGEYCLVHRWGDRSHHDPWQLGFIDGIKEDTRGFTYRVKECPRWFPNCTRLTGKEGDLWIEESKSLGEFYK